jgi:hypothetical protein
VIDKDHRIIAERVPEEYTLIFSIEVALRDWLGEHEEEAPKHVPREVSALRRKKRKREARWPMLSEEYRGSELHPYHAFGNESQERMMTITNGVQFRRHLYHYNTRASISGMQSGSEWFTAKK